MDLIERSSSHILALFRVVVAVLFVSHGVATLFDVMGGPKGGTVPEFAQWPSWWAAAIQVVAGGLVLVGLATRIAALLCSGSMAYAYFVVHLPQSAFPLENGGELAALFSWSFLLIVFLGPGRWALDQVLVQAKGRTGVREAVANTA